MLTEWKGGYLELTVEPSDPGKTYRVMVPGWHEGMEEPYVEEVSSPAYMALRRLLLSAVNIRAKEEV